MPLQPAWTHVLLPYSAHHDGAQDSSTFQSFSILVDIVLTVSSLSRPVNLLPCFFSQALEVRISFPTAVFVALTASCFSQQMFVSVLKSGALTESRNSTLPSGWWLALTGFLYYTHYRLLLCHTCCTDRISISVTTVYSWSLWAYIFFWIHFYGRCFATQTKQFVSAVNF